LDIDGRLYIHERTSQPSS